jgi:hypothetical protein
VADREIPAGVYTLRDIRKYGLENGWCPYFVARHTITLANVVGPGRPGAVKRP